MDSDRPSLIGRQLGAYRVVSLLGKGGMGEVYRAHDTKLGRDVAIKVLPDAFASDPERLTRFEGEARMLAALNHQHIAAIYGFEDSDDIHGIVLELVEGPTLAELIRRPDGLGAGSGRPSGLPLEDALTLARQIADALDAAHAKGIIHRDLKPANIKVTTGNVVKVLDFGLAKATAVAGTDLSQAATMTALNTREGVVVGTAAYMSPEQARGQPLDRRTDVWAFGCVLFEMLTGQSPFAGATVSDTIARILEREPAWAALRSSTPARVRELMRRCLQKDPAKRLGNLAEARHDIEATLASPFKLPRAVAEAVRWQLSRPSTRWTLATVALALGGVVLYQSRGGDAPVPTLTSPVQVTSAVGVEDHPTWSPDGRTLAYESNETGNWDIWLVQIGGGTAVNRTADHAEHDVYASWSPDGRQIAFWSNRDGGGYFVMPALGGAPVRLIATPGKDLFHHSAPEWSADGTRLAAISYQATDNTQVYAEIVSLITSEVERITLPGSEEARLDLSWSRDGRYFAYVDAAQQQSEVTQLRVVRLSDGHSTTVTDGRTNVRRPRWSPDGRYLFYVANREGPPDLWRQTIADDGSVAGEPERVTAGLEVRDAAFSADGTRLAYSKGRWVSNIWRVPILEDRPATWGDAVQMTFDQAFVEFLDVSPDGQRLAYSSDRSGNQDLWVMPIGGQAVQLTFDPAPDWSPGWSPDGRQLAFYSYRTGDREIWTMPATGGAANQVTNSKGLDAGSDWSPDGREIAIRSERTGNSELWVVAADGSSARQLTNHPASDGLASWSPNRQWLAFHSNRSGQNRIWRVRPSGGEPELLTRGSAAGPHWSADGMHLYFGGSDERAGNVWRLSFKDRSERAVTNFTGKRGTLGRMPVDTDGRFIYFTWRDDLGDLWVMDVVQR